MRRLRSVTGGSYPGPGLVTAIITVTNIAAGQNISITKHISDHPGVTGMCRLTAHCYHSEEESHHTTLLKGHKQWELNVTMSP